jgi:hypothetical protein
MLTVRCTRRLLARLKDPGAAVSGESTTRLGDWYANLLRVGRRQLVLLVSERTFLPVVIAAAPSETIVERFRAALADLLHLLKVDQASIGRELAEMQDVTIGRTVSRQVTGVSVDFAKALSYFPAQELSRIECSFKLAHTPLGPLLKTEGFPDRATAALFQTATAAPRAELRAAKASNVDDRPEIQRLFANLKAALPALKQLLAENTSHWGYEDPIYRFYHQSFKVYQLQGATLNIVAALQSLAPERELNDWFRAIVTNGTGKGIRPFSQCQVARDHAADRRRVLPRSLLSRDGRSIRQDLEGPAAGSAERVGRVPRPVPT